MLLIPLAQVPNQAVSFNANDALWSIHVYQAGNFMAADVDINGVNIISGTRCFGGTKVLQYGYMTAPDLGNFVFNEDADWTNFGGSCNLYFLNQAELAQFEAALRNWS